MPQQGDDDGGAGAFRDLVHAHDGGAVLVGADPFGTDLDHRDGATVDGDAEAGKGESLDIPDDLFGRLLRRCQHVYLAYLVAIGGEPHGVDRR